MNAGSEKKKKKKKKKTKYHFFKNSKLTWWYLKWIPSGVSSRLSTRTHQRWTQCNIKQGSDITIWYLRFVCGLLCIYKCGMAFLVIRAAASQKHSFKDTGPTEEGGNSKQWNSEEGEGSLGRTTLVIIGQRWSWGPRSLQMFICQMCVSVRVYC
jgi:hypothetical protein